MGRLWVRSSLAVVLAAAAVLIGWRVLAPAEVLAPVAGPLPSPSTRTPGVTGKTAMAPLIVDGMIRVFASKRQVRADAPVDGKTTYTARWSFRRWPQQVSGVVATGQTVITRWSDGELVAIDALTGKIAWRTSGPPTPGYDGHRTGAATVWAPVGLKATPTSVTVGEGSGLIAYAVSTGARLPTVTPPTPSTSSSFAAPAGDELLGFWNGVAVVLTAGRHLQEINPAGGEVTVDFPLAVGTEKLDWKPGLFSLAGGYVAIERLTTDGPADADAPDHYFTQETVILAAL
jgi:outer membrane protein assembly factor BamB